MGQPSSDGLAVQYWHVMMTRELMPLAYIRTKHTVFDIVFETK